MNVIVNGRDIEVAPPATVSALLATLGIEGPFALVERNGEPVARAAYAEVTLEEGDALVVARPVAGG